MALNTYTADLQNTAPGKASENMEIKEINRHKHTRSKNKDQIAPKGVKNRLKYTAFFCLIVVR